MSEFADGLKQGLSFIVKNQAPQNKCLNIFGRILFNGESVDLMQIPGISEDDVRTSVLKGDVGRKLKSRYLAFVSTTLDFGISNSDSTYAGLLTSLGIITSTSSQSQTSWYISPATGSDTNTGLLGNPLKTLKELSRRLSLSLIRNQIVVNVLDDITDANDFLQVYGVQNTVGTQGVASGGIPAGPISQNYNVALKIVGQRVVSSFTDPNTSSTTALTLTSNATQPQVITTTIASGSNGQTLPQATVNVASTTGMPTAGNVIVTTSTGLQVVSYTGTTGTSFTGCTGGTGTMSTGGAVAMPLPGVLQVTGFDFTSYVGQMVQILSSGVGAAVGAQALIVKAPAVGTAWIAPLAQFSTRNSLSAANQPTTGSTFSIYTTTSWAPHYSAGFIPNSTIQYQDFTFPSAAQQSATTQNYDFMGCTFKRAIGCSFGSNALSQLMLIACGVVFPTPPGGRSPNQWPITGGEIRFSCLGLVNVDMRIREQAANVIGGGMVGVGSQISLGGPNDAQRKGGFFNVGNFDGNSYGVGLFDVPAPDLLAPSPGTTRGSSGAAIHCGHGSTCNIAALFYGTTATSGTVFVRLVEGSRLYLAEKLTVGTPSNPVSPGVPYQTKSLWGTGAAGAFSIDGYTAFFLPADYVSALGGTPKTPTTCVTWADWENTFSRNVVSYLTGASILTMQF